MRVPLLLLLASLALATPGVAAQNEGEHMLHIQSFRYIPDPITVPPGATVIIMSFPDPGQTPEQTEPHTVTAVDRALFDVTNIPADGSQHPFTAPSAPGEYPYYCIYHGDTSGNGMVGTLIVEEGNGTTTPATSTTPASATPTASPTSAMTPAAGTNDAPLGVGLVILGAAAGALLARRR